jgi:glycyl-tRNA synthetase alpha subunit
MRPAPANERQLIFDSLTAIGTEKSRHEIRFREDYWDIPELAIGGRGWEIFLNGIEIGQITEICEVGGIKIDPGMEITYGLERLTQALGLQKESPLTECENQYWGYLDQTVNIDSWYDLMAIYRYECENALDDQKLLPAIDLLNSMHHAYWIINRRSPMGSDEKTLHRSRMQNLCKRWVTMATGAKADAIYREFVAGTHL